MPSKYVLRDFEENGIYHVFNRGVEKRPIFSDEQDYKMFLYYLFIYVVPLEKVLEKYSTLPLRLYNKNLSSKIEILAYCLMPNHFHLLVKQKTKDGTSRFLKQLTNAYTRYLNEKEKRVGGLMQGRFKAVKINTDEVLLHVSRYIHLNPLISYWTRNLDDYKWSSYLSYIGKSDSSICNADLVLSHFPAPHHYHYQKFVLDQEDYTRSLNNLQPLLIED